MKNEKYEFLVVDYDKYNDCFTTIVKTKESKIAQTSLQDEIETDYDLIARTYKLFGETGPIPEEIGFNAYLISKIKEGVSLDIYAIDNSFIAKLNDYPFEMRTELKNDKPFAQNAAKAMTELSLELQTKHLMEQEDQHTLNFK